MNLTETVVLKRAITSNSQKLNYKILKRMKAATFKAGIHVKIKLLPNISN